MEKLTKEIYIEHAKRLAFIIDEKSPFAQYLTRKDFSYILQSQLNILNVLEKKFSDAKVEAKLTTKQILKNFNSITKTNFKINDKFKLDDDTDYIDSINYLVTYCNNIFKVNLDDMLEGKIKTVSSPDIKLNSQEFDEESPKMGAGMFGGMNMGMGADFMDPKQNPFVIGQASVQLQKEISTGKFYRYKTKPKAIPIIKWISVVLILLCCISLLLSSAFAFCLNGHPITDPEQPIYPAITDGIFFILFAGIGIYTNVVFFKSALSKNDNETYFFSWQLLLIFMIGILLAEMFCIQAVFEIGFEFDTEHATVIQTIGRIAYKVMWYIGMGLIGANTIMIILGSVLNPKVDTGAIDKRVGEIVDQMTGGYSAFRNTKDVQTPVEVKKPEKKDDKEKAKK